MLLVILTLGKYHTRSLLSSELVADVYPSCHPGSELSLLCMEGMCCHCFPQLLRADRRHWIKFVKLSSSVIVNDPWQLRRETRLVPVSPFRMPLSESDVFLSDGLLSNLSSKILFDLMTSETISTWMQPCSHWHLLWSSTLCQLCRQIRLSEQLRWTHVVSEIGACVTFAYSSGLKQLISTRYASTLRI